MAVTVGGFTSADELLSTLSNTGDVIDARQVCVVVAHPDDETLGCGAQLARLRDALLVVITDGSPADPSDARRIGIPSKKIYAALRCRELRAALETRGARVDVMALGVQDQTAAFRMAWIARTLAREWRDRQTRLVITHAYEGGHPDHDAAAFSVQMSSRLLSRVGLQLSVLEMPFYRATPTGIARQTFSAAGPPATTIDLSAQMQHRKQKMVHAYASQRWLLQQFDLTRESFRPAPEYRFDALPNAGSLLYERYPWGMYGDLWLRLTCEAQRELGIVLTCA